MTNVEHDGWTVSRTIPIPSSVSAEAQQALRYGGAALKAAAAPPALDDHDGWREYAGVGDAMLVAMFEPEVAALEVSVESIVVEGVPVYVVTPSGVDDDAPIYLEIHGGALVQGGGEACRVMAMRHADRAQMLTWAVDYRLPPDHPYPAGLDDCMTVYRELLGRRDPSRIIVGGASAGGNLAAALILRIRDAGLPLPAGCVLLTPEVDLTESGDSFQTNLGVDSMLTGSLAAQNALYA